MYTNRYWTWRARIDQRHSGKSRFVQKGFDKKELSETDISRREWREHKGFNRDRQKGTCWCKCTLTDSRQGHRAWQRNLLRKTVVDTDAWEEMTEYDTNSFTNGWDCC